MRARTVRCMSEEFLSEPWLQAALAAGEALPGLAGMSAKVNFELAGSREPKLSKRELHAVLQDGRLVELGEGLLAEADCSVVCKHVEARDIIFGQADAEAGYMRGWLKLAGNYGVALFDLRPLYAQREWQSFVRELAELTA